MTPQNNPGNPGHTPNQIPGRNGDGPSGLMGMDLGRRLSNPDMPNVAKELVRMGDKEGDLLMRSYLTDDRQANAVAILRMKLARYGLGDELKKLDEWLALRTSIRGLARDQLVQTFTQTYYPLNRTFRDSILPRRNEGPK